MMDGDLFRLGMDLETGATHEEAAIRGGKAVCTDNDRERSVFDADREDHFIRRNGKVFAGTHLIIEVIDAEGLDDEARIQKAFRDCVEECGATLLHIHTHKFTPQGVSGVAVLAESHISVHTWPEVGYGAFDVFMCGDAEPWRSVEVLRKAFNAGEVRVKEMLRGEGLVD
ncbi:adenosylmethionine decarboxylase [Oceanicella actignis]|uniref:S-adenosylmethionine decarboxylase proenzyme n=1 Tax=Oceanicella actignis TaxID=1189325 RepID=A0A1M7SG02_9RHOB|nr:adenosylmethionine decarboxylase [Oceanicella actignis]TYO91286.1 S-adenosylmethionine decarboxylase [Oceanicella actignis]SET21714.1 S-adenosylmethionine decarboxylase [Oceanicella actignis]SHN57397.1 S-adenosylmethionine decarboxylase [Oceanicella actignis]